ncbi:hypothetical protein [Rubrivivax rivuli]|uniref:Uncharacterized protein n=1 Tax=Rubrivivax rivuli TaxID=1862385 RepID=A0A437RRR7_9BURK|nr:hypothetical protein [Rubrivivax rivuli]RVU49322.1 hypothetical protein EOE66_01750 [Rubrivivax rivuli]
MNKLKNLSVLALAALLAACGGGESYVEAQAPAQAQPSNSTARALAVSTSGRTLVFTYAVPVNAKIVVGPAAGQVQVFGLPDVADGTTYNNINAIDWRSGAADDAVAFEVTQAAEFDVRVDTGAGQSQVDVKWIIPAGAPSGTTPSVHIAAATGLKKIQVQLENFAASTNFAWTQVLGDGDAEVKGEMQFKQGSQQARGLMDLRFGNGLSKAELTVDNESQNLAMVIRPRNVMFLSTKILSDDPANSTSVDFDPVGVATGSNMNFEMVSAAQNVRLGGTLTGGAGMNELLYNFTALTAANVNANVSAITGAGNDKINLAFKGLPATRIALAGNVSAGAGDDEALLLTEGITTGTIGLDCGPGIDKAIGFTRTLGCELN